MRRLLLLGAIPLVLLLLAAVAQLTLPSLAAQRLRDRLGRSGEVQQVEVYAFPAIELLWHHADRVVVRLRSYRSSGTGIGHLLDDAAGVEQIDASADVVQAGLLTLRSAALHKHGAQVSASAHISASDLQSAIPILTSVQPVASPAGTLTLRGTASVLGVSATVDATVAAVNGKLLVAPDVPFGALATLTVFADPRVQVQGVSAAPSTGGFAVQAQASFH